MSIDENNNPPSVLLSTASFYFWLPHYDPLLSLDLIRGLGSVDVGGFDIYVDPRGGRVLADGIKDEHLEFLGAYPQHCLHTDLFSGNWCETATDGEVVSALRDLDIARKKLGCSDIVVHGDYLYKDAKQRLGLLREALPEARIHLELMGKDKVFATHPDHFRQLLTQEQGFYLAPDLAHMQDWRDEYGLQEIFADSILSAYIQIVHVSHHTHCLANNWYTAQGHAESADAVHSLLQCDPEYYEDNLLAGLLRGKKAVLEGIIPLGVDLPVILRREKALIGINR